MSNGGGLITHQGVVNYQPSCLLALFSVQFWHVFVLVVELLPQFSVQNHLVHQATQVVSLVAHPLNRKIEIPQEKQFAYNND